MKKQEDVNRENKVAYSYLKELAAQDIITLGVTKLVNNVYKYQYQAFADDILIAADSNCSRLLLKVKKFFDPDDMFDDMFGNVSD